MTDLERVEPRTNLSTRTAELVEKAQKYAEAAQSPNTIRTYSGASRRWCAWCAENDFDPYPAAPEAVALYQTHLADAGKSWSTINTTLAGIEWYQKMAGHPSFRNSLPVSMVGKGIRRVNGVAPSQAKAITVEQLRKVCDALDRLEDRGFLPVRDKAMILLGFAGGYRRSELVSILVEDVERDPEHGYRVMLRRSKTDQEGVGFEKGIPYGGRKATCPVRAMDSWLEQHPLRTEPGAPLFVGSSSWSSLNSWSVNRVVKAAMTLAGEDAEGYSAHSLRAGFVTAAAKAGKRLDQIMAQTGHKSVEVAMRYIRRVELFNEIPPRVWGCNGMSLARKNNPREMRPPARDLRRLQPEKDSPDATALALDPEYNDVGWDSGDWDIPDEWFDRMSLDPVGAHLVSRLGECHEVVAQLCRGDVLCSVIDEVEPPFGE